MNTNTEKPMPNRILPTKATLLVLTTLLAGAVSSLAQTRELSSPPLAGIAHIALRVRSLDSSRTFYQSLGFEEAFDLKRDGVPYESFIKINDHQFIELYPASAGDTSPAFLHLCFEGNDLNALHDDYVSHGLTPIPVRKAGAGNLLFTLAGPMQPSGDGSSTGIAQNIEYTQYMPGSLHSNDGGKHLGPDRVADRILSVALAMRDIDAAREFYSNQLSFKQLPAEPLLYHLPGTSGEQIEIAQSTLGRRARFTLQTASLSKAARHLSREHIHLDKTKTLLTFNDPDGNTILIQER